jgi:hypothetical protein
MKDRHNIDWDKDYSPRNIASTTDCTGMMYKPPMTEEEAENYEDIYSVPQQMDINAQKTETPRQQQRISSVRKGRR